MSRLIRVRVGRRPGGLVLDAVGATASTDDPPNVAANVLDGDFDTRWSGFGIGATLDLDLGSVKTVGGVRLAWYNPNENLWWFEIRTSTDGVTWVTVWENGEGYGNVFNDFDFVDHEARYVRYYGMGNSAGNPGGWNSVVEMRVLGATGGGSAGPLPSDLDVSAQAEDSQVTVTFAAVDVSTFTLERSTDEVTWTMLSSDASSPYVDMGLTNGTTYHYRVTATNTSGSIIDTASATPQTVAIPSSAPVLTLDSVTHQAASLSWTVVDGVGIVYELRRGGVVVFEGSGTSYVDAIAASTTYEWQVFAKNTAGTGPGSNTVTATSPAPPDAGDPGGTLQTSATRYKTTWTFNDSYLVGSYANGDPWVVAPSGLSITAISPAPTGTGTERRNGAMLNPVRSQAAGYDGRVSSHTQNYNAANDATAGGFPIVLPTNSTFISAVANGEGASHRGVIDEVNVLTVIPEAPPGAGYFRPSPLPGVKTHTYRLDDVNMAILPMLAVPAGQAEPNIPSMWSGRFINDHFLAGHLWRNTQPTANANGAATWAYHRWWGNHVTGGLMQMMTNLSGGKNLELATHVVQYGLDIAAWLKDQSARNSTGYLYSGNDYAHRKALILLVSEMLGVPGIYDDITLPVHFTEDHRYQFSGDLSPGALPWTHAVASSPHTAVLCASSSVGTESHEILHPSQMTCCGSGTHQWGEIYRQCCNVRNAPPQALLVRLMDVQVPGFRARFNNEAYLDFADRWMHETPWDPYKTYFDANASWEIGSDVANIDGGYQRAMWDTYR